VSEANSRTHRTHVFKCCYSSRSHRLWRDLVVTGASSELLAELTIQPSATTVISSRTHSLDRGELVPTPMRRRSRVPSAEWRYVQFPSPPSLSHHRVSCDGLWDNVSDQAKAQQYASEEAFVLEDLYKVSASSNLIAGRSLVAIHWSY